MLLTIQGYELCDGQSTIISFYVKKQKKSNNNKNKTKQTNKNNWTMLRVNNRFRIVHTLFNWNFMYFVLPIMLPLIIPFHWKLFLRAQLYLTLLLVLQKAEPWKLYSVVYYK